MTRVGNHTCPLFRSAVRRTGTLAATAMRRVDAWRMVQRRAAELGMKVKIGYPANEGMPVWSILLLPPIGEHPIRNP
jgi:hypothetical protein